MIVRRNKHGPSAFLPLRDPGRAIVQVTSATLVVQILMTWDLWFSVASRPPVIPAFGFLPLQLGHWGSLLGVALLGALAGLLFRPGDRKVLGGVLIILCILVLADVTRLQPWLYLDVLLLVLAMVAKTDRRALNSGLQILLGFTYVWSGVQKCNAHYPAEVAGWLFGPLLGESWLSRHAELTYFSAVFEFSTGALLLVGRTRRLAFVGALIMHSGLVLLLGLVHRWNAVVIPWNLQMLLLAFPATRTSERIERNRFTASVTILVGFLPIFNLLPQDSRLRWDSLLSGAYYSATTLEAAFVPGDETSVAAVAKREFGGLGANSEEDSAAYLLVDYAYFDRLHVPFYPERRYYKYLLQELCSTSGPNDKAIMLITRRDRFSMFKWLDTLRCDRSAR